MELESDATPIVIPRSDVLDGLVTLATRLLMAQLFLIALRLPMSAWPVRGLVVRQAKGVQAWPALS